MRCYFRFLAVLASISSLSSVNAADPGLATLPDAPQPGKPFMVYYDGAADAKATWQAFYMGHSLDKSEFEAQGSWLKIQKSRLGNYMFVLSYGDKLQLAKTVELTEPVGVPQGTPQFGVQGLPQAFWRGAQLAVPQGTPQGLPHATPQGVPQAIPSAIPQQAPQQSPLAIRPDLRGMLDANGLSVIKRDRSPIDTAIYSSLRNHLATFPAIVTDVSVRERTQIAYAEALEQVARSAVQNKWTTPRINQEAVDAIRKRGGSDDQLFVEELETLLKTVALRFSEKTVEESPADAILALVSLATVLRDNPELGIRRPMQPQRSLEAPQLSEAPSMSVAAPCCQGGRFLRRR